MAVTSTNSNSYPMSVTGVTHQNPPLNPNPGNGAVIGIPPVYVSIPPQVMGLVPVFPCCTETATIWWVMPNTSGTSEFTVTIGGQTTAQFTVAGNYTAAQVKAAVDAVLPTGFATNVTITSAPPARRFTVTITAPPFSGSEYSGVVVTLNLILGTDTYGSTNFTNTANVVQCDCRYGLYGADSIPDDRQFVLPVFADLANTDDNNNDFSDFLFQYSKLYNPLTNGDFRLQTLTSGVWVDLVTLGNSTNYGIPYNNNFGPSGTSCGNKWYYGYQISWRKVLRDFGEGYYRFAQIGNATKDMSYCAASPPYCLKEYDCNLASGTVKFVANYSGGHFGSVTQQGVDWTLCCNGTRDNTTYPLTKKDSVRFAGFFGYQTFDYQRDSIKYQTGQINKIRDEAIKIFTFKSDLLPKWAHDRFATYGLMCDKLQVWDYNLNNSDYNLKKFWIVADSSYNPRYGNGLRNNKVIDVKFKEGQQYIYRDRCC